MGFWSTFQEATYHSASERDEFISAHSLACANSSSSVVLHWKRGGENEMVE